MEVSHGVTVVDVQHRTERKFRNHRGVHIDEPEAWVLGDLPAALERSRAELESFGIGRANAGARGLDLVAGLGLHTIPMADELVRDVVSEGGVFNHTQGYACRVAEGCDGARREA